MAEPADAVANAAAKFAAVETACQKAIDNLNKLPKDFHDVHVGDIPDMPEGAATFGYLEMSEFSARARTIAGMFAQAQLALFEFHRDCTARAVSLGIDPPGILSGGGR